MSGTLYVQDDQVAALQREGYRCAGRTPAGDMIMRPPEPKGIIIHRSNTADLSKKVARLEQMAADQAALIGALRSEIKALKAALPKDHPLMLKEITPGGTHCELAKLRQAAAVAFEVPLPQLCGKGRNRPVARARHAFFTLAHKRTRHSTPVIGRAVGVDHTSVLYGLERARTHWANDPDFTARMTKAEELADED